MNARSISSALIAIALCICTLTAGSLGAARAQTRSNIVVIMTDDLDLESLNALLTAGLMPNLQKYIISPGVTFTNSFISNSHGCPARQTLFTGLYYHNIGGATDNCSVARFNDKNTLAVWLHNAGYQTALIGRYTDGYGYTDINHDGVVNMQDATYIPPGWDNWQAFVFPYLPPSRTVWWYENANMYNYTMNDNGTIVNYGITPQDYQVDVVSQRAANYVTNVVGGSTAPFFLLVASTAPHVEAVSNTNTINNYQDAWRWDIHPAPRYVGSVHLPLPMPPSFNESNISDKPNWVQQVPLLRTIDVTNLTRQYQDRLAAMRAVDDLIGNLANALTATGKLQNTVLIFTSDNGWFYAQHRLSGKLAAYDESVRVPLYITGQAPAIVSAMVGNTDLAPTIADLAHVTPGGRVDGVSLVPLLTQPDQPWRNRFLLENWEDGAGGVFAVPTYYAVRTGPVAAGTPNETYVQYADGEGEFYDDTADPYQRSNLWLNTSPGRIQQRMVLGQQLTQMQTCRDGSCQQDEFAP